MMMMMMMMMMKKVSLWALQQIISSVDDGVSYSRSSTEHTYIYINRQNLLKT